MRFAYIFATEIKQQGKGKVKMDSNNSLRENLYSELRKHRGSIKELSGRTGRSRQWVRVVLKGDFADDAVYEEAAQVLLEFRARSRKVKTLMEKALAN
jgi:RNA polymerase-binding transcription factor DksA